MCWAARLSTCLVTKSTALPHKSSTALRPDLRKAFADLKQQSGNKLKGIGLETT